MSERDHGAEGESQALTLFLRLFLVVRVSGLGSGCMMGPGPDEFGYGVQNKGESATPDELSPEYDEDSRNRVKEPRQEAFMSDVGLSDEPIEKRSNAARRERPITGPWSFSLTGGLGKLEGNQLEVGFERISAISFKPISRNDARVTVRFVNTRVSYEFGPKGPFFNTKLFVNGGYQWGIEKDSSRTRPRASAGWSYDHLDGNGLPDVEFQKGGEARAENGVRFLRLSAGVGGDVDLGSGVTLSPQMSLIFRQLNQRSWGDFRTITASLLAMFPNDIDTSETTQYLVEQSYGIGTEVQLSKAISGTALSVFAGGGLTGLYRVAHLESEQKNRCPYCGLGDNNFTAKVNAEDRGFTYAAKGSIGLAFDLLPGSTLTLKGDVEYLEARGVVVKKKFAGDVKTDLEAKEAFDWTVGLGWVQKF